MSHKTVRFFSKERTSSERVAQLLRELADKLQQNRVTFRRDGEEVSVAVPDELMLEIKVEEKAKKYGRKSSLDIEIEWLEGRQESRGGVSVE